MFNKIKNIAYSLVLLFFWYNLSAQSFLPLTTGTDGEIDELFVDTVANVLFVGGDFSMAGDSLVMMSAIWDGSGWHYAGFRWGGRTYIEYKGQLFQSGIYGSGYLEQNIPSNQCCSAPLMKRINNGLGYEWQPVGKDSNAFWGFTMYDIEVEKDTMYLFGDYSQIGGISCYGIAKYDGTNFYPFAVLDTEGIFTCAKFYKGELYVGGNFRSQADPSIADIAKWNGHSWEGLGSPLTGFMTSVGNMEIYNGELIVTGGFSKSWGDKANGIMSWDGTQWKELGTGMKLYGKDLLVYENELYVTGQILSSPTSIKRVAKWNGSIWSGIGIDTMSNGTFQPSPGGVLAIAEWNGDIYIAGLFDQINGVACKNIARYSTTTGVFSPVFPQSNIAIYPNPANNTCYITLPDGLSAEMILIDLQGKIIEKRHLCELITEINTQNISSGIYLAKLQLSNGTINTLKIAIQH